MYKKLFFVLSIVGAVISASAQPYCWLWQKNAGSTSDDGGKWIAVYANTVYNSGMFTTATINLDDSTFNNRGARDVYLVKRDDRGNMLWAKTLGGPLNESAAKIDVDSHGDVYIGGTFSGTMQADSAITSNGGTDIYIAKYNALGKMQWIENIGSTGNDSLMTLVVDANDRLRIVGSFSATLVLGPYTLNASSGTAFIASLQNQSGTVLSAKNYNAPLSTQFIRADKSGSFYYAGTAYSVVTFGSYSLSPACQPIFSSPSVFWAAKLDTAANVVWLKDLAPCNDLTNLGYYRNYLDFFVDRAGLIYFAFIEGRWPAFIGPSPGDPYVSFVAVYSTDGVLIERGGPTFNGFLGANSITRYMLDAANRKVLLRNVTFGQLEYVTNIITQSSINDALVYVQAQNYFSGAINEASGTFYFTGKSFLNKLGKQFEANAGADKFYCSTPATPITVGGNPAASCGVPPYAHSWSPATGLSSTTVANPTLNLSTVTDSILYVLTVTDATSVVKRDTVKVVNAVPAIPTITPVNNTLVTNATSGIQWFFNGQPIPNATNPGVVAHQPGQYAVQVTNSYGCSVMSTPYEVLITEMKLVVSTSAGVIRIRYTLPAPATTTIELINISTGIKNRLQQNVRQPAGIYTFSVSIGRFSSGAYIVRIITDDRILSTKLIIR